MKKRKAVKTSELDKETRKRILDLRSYLLFDPTSPQRYVVERKDLVGNAAREKLLEWMDKNEVSIVMFDVSLPAPMVFNYPVLAGRFIAQRSSIERITLDIPADRHAEVLAYYQDQGWTILGDNGRGTIVCEIIQTKKAPDFRESHPAY